MSGDDISWQVCQPVTERHTTDIAIVVQTQSLTSIYHSPGQSATTLSLVCLTYTSFPLTVRILHTLHVSPQCQDAICYIGQNRGIHFGSKIVDAPLEPMYPTLINSIICL